MSATLERPVRPARTPKPKASPPACELCDRVMLRTAGCDPHAYRIVGDGRLYVAYASGSVAEIDAYRPQLSPRVLEMIVDESRDPNSTCHDCGAHPGHFHHPGCDVERCPRCEHQFIGCECEWSNVVFLLRAGTRIRLTHSTDDKETRREGTLTDVGLISAAVRWDTGDPLPMLIYKTDAFEVVTP